MRVPHVLSLLVLPGLGVACQTGPQSQPVTSRPTPQVPSMTTEASAVSTATIVVHGMGCPLCANNVDKQLLAIPGVRSADVDLGTGEVAVGLDPSVGVTPEQLADAVRRSGYTPVRVTFH